MTTVRSRLGILAMVGGGDLRRRWRGALALTLVLAIGGGGVIASWAGARRADTSFERFRVASRDAHAFVGFDEAPERLREVGELAGVAALARFGFVPIHPVGADDDARVEGGGFASIDGVWLYEVETPRVLAGAVPDPDATDEMMVNDVFARDHDVRVGDVVPMRAATATARSVDDAMQSTTVHLRVAGIVRTVLDIGGNAGSAVVYLPPGFVRANPEVHVVQGFAAVRLDGGDETAPAFEARLREQFADEKSLSVGLVANDSRYVDQALDVQATALRVVAGVLALAAGALVMQMTARRVRSVHNDARVLRGLGAGRGLQLAAAVVPAAVPALIGSAGAVGLAVAISSTLPRGLARAAEPDPGRYLDASVVGLVALSAIVYTMLVAGWAAVGGMATGARTRARTTTVGERVVGRLRAAGGSPVLLTGMRHALAPSLSTRSGSLASHVGIVVGLTGLIAALAAGDRLAEVAERSGSWGTPFELRIELLFVERPVDPAEVADTDGVAAVTHVGYAESVKIDGSSVPFYGVDAVKGPLAVTAVEGRLPESSDELMLGVETAAQLDVELGDRLSLPAGRSDVNMTVVGVGLFPVSGDGSYDVGALALREPFDQIDHDEPDESLWVAVESGVEVDVVASRLAELGAAPGPTEPPSEQRNLQSVQGYPTVVAAIFMIVMLAALANALWSRSASRRLELATLRAVGFTIRQVRGVVRWHGVLVAALSAVVAAPVGISAARAVWRAYAHELSLDDALALPGELVPAVIAGLLLVVLLVVAPAGGRLATPALAEELRSE